MNNMYRSIVFILAIYLSAGNDINAQIIYREDFSTIPLIDGVGFLPLGMSSLRADSLSDDPDYRNVPFNDPAFSLEGWAVRKLDNNPCAVATGFITGTGEVDRWLLTPVITGNSGSSKLEWREANYMPLGSSIGAQYEVWVTNDTSGTPDTSQFTAVPANKIFFGGGHEPGMVSHVVSLSQFAAGPIRIAFRLKDSTWPIVKWQLVIDDITVFNASTSYNMAADIVHIDKFVAPGDSSRMFAVNTNLGLYVSGYTWHVAFGNYHDSVQVNALILSGTQHILTYEFVVPSLVPGEYNAKFWVSDYIGGNYDTEKLNDTLNRTIHIIGSPVPRNVLVEEFTGAWCGYCPDGVFELNTIETTRNWLIPVSIHTLDSMTEAEAPWIAYNYDDGFPSMIADRRNHTGDLDHWAQNNIQKWEGTIDSMHQRPSIATVSILNQNFDWNTRAFSVTVEIGFTDDATGPFAMNCWLTEDNVFGPVGDTSDNGWNNHSYMNNDSNSVFFGMGSLLDPSEYVHNNVLIKILTTSCWGDTSLIPDTVTAGSTYAFMFQDTLPESTSAAHIWIPQDISVVAFVSLFNDYKFHQEIVNAGSSPFNTSVNGLGGSGNISLYPNPATDNVTVKCNLKSDQDLTFVITDASGRNCSCSYQQRGVIGENNYALDTHTLTPGVYFINVISEEGIRVLPFVKTYQ